jgi:hypothetical protein
MAKWRYISFGKFISWDHFVFHYYKQLSYWFTMRGGGGCTGSALINTGRGKGMAAREAF